jgi:hypothetical protein
LPNLSSVGSLFIADTGRHHMVTNYRRAPSFQEDLKPIQRDRSSCEAVQSRKPMVKRNATKTSSKSIKVFNLTNQSTDGANQSTR